MSINLGSLSGAPIWGIVSDKKGRKFTYLLSTILSAIAVTIAALSNSFNMLVGMQFVIGFVISGYSVCTILISEFVPTEKRGKTLAGLQIFKV
jgi:MFS family permease